MSGIGGDFSFAINLDCFTLQKPTADGAPQQFVGTLPQGAPATVDESLYTAYSLARASQVYRNRLESVLLSHADANCEKEKGSIYAKEASVGLAFDVLASGLSTASTIVGGEQAKSILAGLAGLSTATRSHVTANVYKNQIIPAITNVIDAERRKLLTEIIARRPLALESYTADDMIRMVNGYHQACSFQLGLQLLLQASENKAGTDALLKNINLAASRRTVQQAMTAASARGDTDTYNALQEKLRSVELEAVTNFQTAGNALVESGSTAPDETQPQEDETQNEDDQPQS
ncbi:hypothetical protein [Sphingobium sp. SYK-6]|uniref:hypothetical protein n=1 Tax=Sphingobium sp. (strain NBRC 103272 / SYK-6) TaxID=627192 RepID=UPI0013142184|nr:hypothetical protein [Sphingobium sp. SYK-6]